ncbi:MAG: hypothetical protein KY462_15975 [Actinobacteria bacterium]|nr:hypothetical protein [Actinomycetota bacterium]
MVDTATRTDNLRDLTRKVAERQLTTVKHASRSLQRYAELLRRYADGEKGAAELGKDVMNLAVDQCTRGTEDAIEVSADYYRWLWSLAGVEFRAPADEDRDREGVSARTSGRERSG